MRSKALIAAIRGPVVMITVGVLFLLDRLTGLRFSETWPILLIVSGVLALAGGSKRGNIPPLPTNQPGHPLPPEFPDVSGYPNRPPNMPPPGVRR